MKGPSYQMQREDGRLVFRTPSFRAERGSVLHVGIYNRELTSSLAAAALLLVIFFLLLLAGVRVTALYAVPAIGLFAAFFIFFRRMVFYEEYLEAVIDKAREAVTISVKRFMGKTRTYSLKDLVGVREEDIVITPENPDGIAFVEKIALQHGTVIPGFGEEKEYFTVELEFSGGRRERIFSSEEATEALEVVGVLKEFLEGSHAQAD